MSDPAMTIDLIALADRETGAPDPDPNRDAAFDADEAEARADWQKPRPPALPAPWAMSIRELDSWHDHYTDRERLGLAPLTNADRRHRAEVEQNIHMRHEARRHSCYP
jgi:hypothetical protein